MFADYSAEIKIAIFQPFRNAHMSVSLSVCLCLSTRITRKPHRRTSQTFCRCCPWPRLSPPLTALRYVIYFRYSELRHIFHTMEPVARIKHDVMLRSSLIGSTGQTSDNCSGWLSSSECGTEWVGGRSLLSTIDLFLPCVVVRRWSRRSQRSTPV